ncbi:MAG: EVE domain-containing protein [Proteobacteria bacterium]|nr:EVE domain-containing protein [Pseudomonadota bacterium]
MAFWLMKSEPDVWSWAQQVKKGIEPWTGVRNHQAAKNLRTMAVGDKAFFYHSNDGREIVGIVSIVKKAYTDPSDETGKFVCVDVKAEKPMPKPVTLAQVKADAKLKDMALIKLSRLSVQPVSEAEWKHICKLGGL